MRPVLSGTIAWIMSWVLLVCAYFRKCFCNNQVNTDLVSDPVEILQDLKSDFDEWADDEHSANQSRVRSISSIRHNQSKSN